MNKQEQEPVVCGDFCGDDCPYADRAERFCAKHKELLASERWQGQTFRLILCDSCRKNHLEKCGILGD